MFLLRVLTAAVKPALAGGVAAAVAGGAYVAWDAGRDDPTAFERIQSQGQQLLISEFGQYKDTIVAVDPADTSRRTEIATIDHAEGYGVFPALSPDGRAVAYTALPRGTGKPGPDAPAQAAVIGVDGGVTLLADDVDLLVPPVWAPDGSAIVVRRNTPADDGAGSFELLLLGLDGARSTITTFSRAAVFPVAFAPDGGTLYFATINPDGSDLYAVAPDGSDERLIARLSTEITREWTLSRDGTRIAFSAAEAGAEPRVVTRVVDLASRVISDVAGGNGASSFSPAWSGDALTVAVVADDGSGGDVVALSGDARSGIATEAGAVNLPLTWSPDNAAMVVRSVDGQTTAAPGKSRVELVGPDGSRADVSDQADVLIVGWLE